MSEGFSDLPAQVDPGPLAHNTKLAAFLTCKLALGQELLGGAVEQQDAEGVLLAGVQPCQRGPAPAGGQHQLWLGHRCKRPQVGIRKAERSARMGRRATLRLEPPPCFID